MSSMKGRVLSRGGWPFLTFVCGIGVVIIGIRGRRRGFGALPRTSLQSCRARSVGSSALPAGRDCRRRWWRLTRRVESGIGLGGGWAQVAVVVGGRFADCVPAWEEAPVIHSVARGGPECRAVLGGSIKRAAVLLECEEEARHRSELARACTSHRGDGRESGVSWWWSCGLGQVVVVVVGGLGQAADLAVAQPVVAEGEDLAGDRDLGDLAPAAFGDPLEGGA
jgi:hypothetical protein